MDDEIWAEEDGNGWFKCPECNTEVERHPWTAAHLHIHLTGKCTGCGITIHLGRDESND